jgi:DNA primase
MYYCFVCHETGDVFTFVQKILKMDFTASVKYVGEQSGIEVVDTPRRAQAPDPNARNWEVLAMAAEWFHAQLMHETVGRVAMQYLNDRGIDSAAIDKFSLGYAPRDAALLRSHLHTFGFDDTRQLECGILSSREGESEPRANFRNRVMFPIVDEAGHHVGFGGRALGDGIPKYLNSAESAVFHKRQTLYGMHAAKHAMRRAERALVVEGYMDAIRVALSGVEEVVAPLGTALTEEQAALIVKHAHEVFLLYDSDEAGQKATFRSGKILLNLKASVRVVSFPSGEDPDTFIRKHGRAGLETQLAQAMDLFDLQVQMLAVRGMFTDLSKRRRAIDRLLPTIRAAADPLTRDLYLTRLSEMTGLDKSNLAKEADEPAHPEYAAPRGTHTTQEPRGPTSQPGEWHGEPAPDAPTTGRPSQWQGRGGRGAWKGKRDPNALPEFRSSWLMPTGSVEEPAERALIAAMLADRGLVERIAERHGPDDFRDMRYRALFGVLLVAGADEGLDQIAERLDDDSAAALHELLHRSDGQDAEAVDVSLNMRKLDVRNIGVRLDEIRKEMKIALPEQLAALQREEKELTRERMVLRAVQ